MIKVLIQVEAGSCDRHLYNEKTLEYKGSKRMSQPVPYPYGFIPGTSGADGDCLDCYIITRDKLKARSVIECEPVGLLEQVEDGEADHKVLAALPGQHVELNRELREELSNFINEMFAAHPDVHIHIGQILPRQAALHHIKEFLDK
jgi:inorganic pyrophosphatase